MLLLSVFGKEVGSSACDEFHIKYLDLVMSSSKVYQVVRRTWIQIRSIWSTEINFANKKLQRDAFL